MLDREDLDSGTAFSKGIKMFIGTVSVKETEAQPISLLHGKPVLQILLNSFSIYGALRFMIAYTSFLIWCLRQAHGVTLR